MLEQEIDKIFTRLNRKVTDPEVACAAIKQLARAHFRPRTGDNGEFERFVDILFRRYNHGNAILIANEVKSRIQQVRAFDEAVEWLNA